MPTGVYERKLQTHCKAGHELTPENIYVYPSGIRACKICRADRSKRWFEENPAYSETRVERRDKDGLCRRCNKLAVLGKTFCEECSGKDSEMYRKKIQDGCCVMGRCSRRPIEGKTLCLEHTISESLRRHHLPRELYDAQIAIQENHCACCPTIFSYDKDRFSTPCIDHEHNKVGCSHLEKFACSNCFRSLLCGACNAGLGLLGDSPDIVVERMQRLKSLARKQ